MSSCHTVFLVPGMFGFGRLAGIDYFEHVRAALRQRFSEAGLRLDVEVVPAPPTSSLRHRARILTRVVRHTVHDRDQVLHLVGHSTGGLDIRLVLSPTANLGAESLPPDLRGQVRHAVSVNTPHYGTPLAGYFSTVAGTRLLYLVSLLSMVSLSLGEPPLSMVAKLVRTLSSLKSSGDTDRTWFAGVSEGLLRVLDRSVRSEVVRYLRHLRDDQGGLIQIMPEAIDLFNAATLDNPEVHYGCIATAAPPPHRLRFARRLLTPYAAATAAVFSTMYQLASKRPKHYPYAELSVQQADQLRFCMPGPVDDTMNDGVVPTLSMPYGRLLWCGEADHLDILGHFRDGTPLAQHRDWMTSGAHFTRFRFEQAMDALAKFLQSD